MTYVAPPHRRDPADMDEKELYELVTNSRSAVLLDLV